MATPGDLSLRYHYLLLLRPVPSTPHMGDCRAHAAHRHGAPSSLLHRVKLSNIKVESFNVSAEAAKLVILDRFFNAWVLLGGRGGVVWNVCKGGVVRSGMECV